MAAIQRRERRPLEGLGQGAAEGGLLPLVAVEGRWVPSPHVWLALTGVGAVSGFIGGVIKMPRTVYEYPTNTYSPLDIVPPLYGPAGRTTAARILSTPATWATGTLTRLGRLELQPGATPGTVELDFGYRRILLRPSAGLGRRAEPLSLSVDLIRRVDCEERPDWPETNRNRASNEVLWCRIDYDGAGGWPRSVFVRARLVQESNSDARQQQKKTQVISGMQQLLGDKQSIFARPGAVQER